MPIITLFGLFALGATPGFSQVTLTYSELCGIVFHQSTLPLERLLRDGQVTLTSNQIHSLVRTYQEELRRSPEGTKLSARIVAVLGSNFYRLANYMASRMESRAAIARYSSGNRDHAMMLRREAVTDVFTQMPVILRNFDPERGVLFSSYFATHLRYQLPSSFIRAATGNSKKISSDASKTAKQAAELRNEYRASGVVLSDEELLALLQIETPTLSLETLRERLSTVQAYYQHGWTSLNSAVRSGDEESRTPLDELEDHPLSEEREFSVFFGDQADVLRFQKEVLIPFKKQLLQMKNNPENPPRRTRQLERYLYIWEHRILGDEPQGHDQIGKRFEVSRELIRQNEVTLLEMLRSFIRMRRFDIND